MRLRFISTQTLKGLWSNRAMAVSVMLVTFVSLLFIGSASLLQKQIGVVRDQWLSDLEISVFMCPANSNKAGCADGEATDKQIAAIRKELTDGQLSKYVEKFRFETKGQALENYRKQMKGSGFEDGVTKEDMQVSFRIKLTDPSDYRKVTETLTGRPGVETVEDQSQQVDPLIRVLDRLSYVSAGLAVVMVVVALLLIPTTLRLSAMSTRDEPEIMRYVGASNFFIELPFILEGAAAALIGSLLAVGGLWAAVVYFIQEWLSDTVTWIRQIQTSDLFVIAPWLVVGAVLVAASASWITLRRYAKV